MHIIDSEGDARELVEDRAWWVVVLSYSITHGRWMELDLNDGEPPSRGIICKGVKFFSGPLEGGPYRLKVIEEDTAAGRMIGIISQDGQLVIRCSDIQRGKIRYKID